MSDQDAGQAGPSETDQSGPCGAFRTRTGAVCVLENDHAGQHKFSDDVVAELRDERDWLRAENERLRGALLVAGQLGIDEIGDVDLHDEAYRVYVERTGRDDGEDPSLDDYAEAFVRAALRLGDVIGPQQMQVLQQCYRAERANAEEGTSDG